MQLDPEKNEACVSLKAAVPSSVKDLQDASFAMYVNNMTLKDLQSVRAWQPQQGLRHFFDLQLMSSISSSLHEAVVDLLQAMIHDPAALVLTRDTSETEFELTEVAKERIVQCVVLGEHQPLLRRCPEELSSASTYQLILETDYKGWTHEVVSVGEVMLCNGCNTIRCKREWEPAQWRSSSPDGMCKLRKLDLVDRAEVVLGTLQSIVPAVSRLQWDEDFVVRDMTAAHFEMVQLVGLAPWHLSAHCADCQAMATGGCCWTCLRRTFFNSTMVCRLQIRKVIGWRATSLTASGAIAVMAAATQCGLSRT